MHAPLPFAIQHAERQPRIVLAHGTFDHLHLGHIRHLQEAKARGDLLFVGVTSDRYVRANKGAGRPHFTAEERKEALLALDCVDNVIIVDAPNSVALIEALRPSVYVKGGDYRDVEDENLFREKTAIETVGGEMYFTTPTPWHSSDLSRAKSLDDETLSYLARAKRFLPAIRDAFDRAKDLKIMLVGEHIIDEYRYVRPLGKCSKEPLVATVADHTEEFHGGVIIATEHAKAVSPKAIAHTAFRPIRKTRFVSTDYNRKLFEVYDRSGYADEEDRQRFVADLKNAVGDADVVIAFDFGHGLIDRDARIALHGAEFLAVNAQSNSANYGFNPVTKYLKADYVCVDEPEARLAVQNQHGTTTDLLNRLAIDIDCPHFVVTHGQHGTATLQIPNRILASAEIRRVPVFSREIVDTMGAGDAFLAVTAPLVSVGLDLEAAAIVGNVAGAIKCSIVGHRRAVGRDELIQTVENLLK